jgi:hypothetical protein
MRTVSSDSNQVKTAPAPHKGLDTFSTVLKDGRTITIREMTGRDLIFMEKDLSNTGDIEKGMRIIERLIVGDEQITYDEIQDLGVRDFKKLSELIAKANGDESTDPN